MKTEIEINHICYTCAIPNENLVCAIRGKVDANDCCKHWKINKVFYERRELIRVEHPGIENNAASYNS